MQHHRSHQTADEADAALSPDDNAGKLRNANQHLLLAGLRAQEQAEEAQRSLIRLNALLESLDEAVTIVDATGAVVLMNQAARTIYDLAPPGEGSSPQTISQLDWRRSDGTTLPASEWPINRILRGEHFDELELVLMRPDGSQLLLIATGSAIFDDQGQVMLGIVIHRDVTVQRELERQKEDFLNAVAHDLRTPLTTMRGFTQLLLRHLERGDRLDSTRTRRYLTQIDAMTRRMASQIDELLARHQNPLDPARDHDRPAVDLGALVNRVVSEHQETRKNCHITLEADEGALLGSWDVNDLERILSNLLSNAIKYSPEGGQIEVSLRREAGSHGPQVVLAVRDRGAGIPANDLPHIFERYFRASSVGEIAGSGIGLTGVSETVARYGGTVSVESTVDRGTIFTVRLPLEISLGA